MKSTLVFIVSYNAQEHIQSVLSRIPAQFYDREQGNEVLIIDDASKDDTVVRAQQWVEQQGKPVTIFRNPVNQGYGGNQKLGYSYAMKQGFKAVVLLHGDGQYAPELLAEMAAPILNDQADAVLGSRMLKRMDALKGGMPLYKWFANQLITGLQNRLLKASLSEFHTGYRAWATAALKRLPFLHNSPDFDFDTEILIQSLNQRLRMHEIAIPTHYGDEICHVNGPKYALQVIHASIISRLQRFGVFYTPKYDYIAYGENVHYVPKLGLESSHTFALAHCAAGSQVLDLGCGDGVLVDAMKAQGARVFGVDKHISASKKAHFDGVLEKDLEQITSEELFPSQSFDAVLILDVIEHFTQPEAFLMKLRERFGVEQPKLILTSPNIAFILMRLGLLAGQFNYGKRGILDFTHTRLFTFRTLCQLLSNYGYRIERVQGIPVPFELLFGTGKIARVFLKVNKALIRLSRSLFSYQIAIEAYPMPTAQHLLAASEASAQALLAKAS